MKKIFAKGIFAAAVSFVLIMIMCATAMPKVMELSANGVMELAAGVKVPKGYKLSSISSEKTYEDDYDASEIIAEDIAKRTETSKTFVQADGTYLMQEYGSAVNYLNDGEYLPIDNTIGSNFRNTANSLSVSFSQGYSDGLVNVSNGAGSVSMTPSFASATSAGTDIYVYDGQENLSTTKKNVSQGLVHKNQNGLSSDNNSGNNAGGNAPGSNNGNPNSNNGSNGNSSQSNSGKNTKPNYTVDMESITTGLNIKNQGLLDSVQNSFANLNSSVYYSDIYSNIDLQYMLEGTSLKENIVINAALDDYTFRFDLDTNGLTASLTEQGDILICDANGETIYTIPAGYMYDAAGNTSDAVYYSLEFANGEYYLTINTDKAFFENCMFPVVIDPSIVAQSFNSSSMTTGRYYEGSSWNDDKFITGRVNVFLGALGDMRNAYIKFNDPAIADIMYKKSSISAQLNINYSTDRTFEATIKQSTDPGRLYNATTVDYLDVTKNTTSKIMTIDVYDYLSSFLGQSSISIRDTGKGSEVTLSNPVLSISYTDKQSDLSIKQDLSQGGQGQVNLDTGKLNYTFEDVSVNDGNMPIEISHVYSESTTNYNVGTNFKLNIQQSVKLQDNNYCYIDASGRSNFFNRNAIPENKVLGLKLYGTSGSTIRLIDRQGNSMVFNPSGNLIEMHQYPSTNTSKKAALYLTINYVTATSNQVSSVTNNNTTLIFGYTGTLLTSIKNSNATSSYSAYTYDSLNRLTSAQKYFTASPNLTTFTYNSNTTLLQIANSTGDQVQYTYDGTTANRINTVTTSNTNISGSSKIINIKQVDNTLPSGSIKNWQYYYIKNASSGLYLDVRNAKSDDGTIIQQWTYNGNPSQKWKAVYNTDDNSYSLQPQAAGNSFLENVSGNYKINYGVIPTNSQRFQISYLNGQATLLNNGKAMAVTSNSNGLAVTAEVNSGSAYQHWVFVPVDSTSAANTEARLSITKTISITTSDSTGDYFRDVSLCCGKVVSDSAYKLSGTSFIPEVATATDFSDNTGFDYFDFTDTYSNTRDVIMGNYNTAASYSSISQPVQLLPANESFAVSTWIKNSQSASVTFTVTPSNGKAKSFVFNSMLTDWQFATIKLSDGDMNGSTSATLSINSTAPFNVGLLRMMKLPCTFTSAQLKTFTPEVNSYGQTVKVYKLNPNDNTISCFEFGYIAPSGDYPGQVYYVAEWVAPASVTSKAQFDSSKTRKSVTQYTYYSSFLTKAVTYGALESLPSVVSYGYDYTTGRLTSYTDANGVTTNYSYAGGVVTSSVTGTGVGGSSPNISSVNTYIPGTNLLASTTTGGISTNFGYTNFGALGSITHNGFNTNFAYGADGSLQSISVPGYTLANYMHSESGNGSQDTVAYGNGQSVAYNYKTDGSLASIVGSDNTIFGYTNDELSSINSTGGVIYDYSGANSIIISSQYSMYNNGDTVTAQKSGTDSEGNTKMDTYLFNGTVKDTCSYYYKSSGQINAVSSMGLNGVTTYNYDPNQRLSMKRLPGNSYYAYTYNDSSTEIGGQVKTTSFSANSFSDTYNYTYYPNGNLKTMVGPSVNVEYVYDKYNRLSIENNYLTGIAYEYIYDSGGNISSKSCYVINGNYISSGGFYYTNMWKDQLTAFDGGYNITYDEAGNPTLYKGASLTWINGRQLASYTASWGSKANYTYDYAGIRTSKTVDGVTTKYFVQGDRILAEKTGSDLTWYYYDETGVCGMQYQGVNYIFEKNILGDVVAIYRVSDGMYMGRYTYNNAWGYGPGTSSNIAVAGSSAVLNANPFRYRGYYFDKETCLYYLNSRYYDPETGRFLNADDPTSLFTNATTTFGTNLYIYCADNPISYTDSTGMSIFTDIWKGITGAANAVGNAAAAVGNAVGDAASWVWNDVLVPTTSWVWDTGVGLADDVFGVAATWYEGAKGLTNTALGKISKGLMWASLGIDAVNSSVRNFSNKMYSFGIKVLFTACDIMVSATILACSVGVAALVGLIPGIGPAFAGFAGIGTAVLLNYLYKTYVVNRR